MLSTKKPSSRQVEILELAAKGYTDKEIAQMIGISIGTLRTYWDRMRDRIGARSRCELLARTYEHNSSANRWLQFLEVLPLFVWTCRPDGRLDYFNEWFLHLPNVDTDALQEHGWCAIVAEEEREPCKEFVRRTLTSCQAAQHEFRIESDKGGALKRHLVWLIPVSDTGGSVARWIGYAREMAQDADAQLASLLGKIVQNIPTLGQ